jgi:hypothetical protein
VVIVPIVAVKYQGSEQVVYVVKGEKVETRKVTTGISDDTNIEILSGVEPGESVVLAGYPPNGQRGPVDRVRRQLAQPSQELDPEHRSSVGQGNGHVGRAGSERPTRRRERRADGRDAAPRASGLGSANADALAGITADSRVSHGDRRGTARLLRPRA